MSGHLAIGAPRDHEAMTGVEKSETERRDLRHQHSVIRVITEGESKSCRLGCRLRHMLQVRRRQSHSKTLMCALKPLSYLVVTTSIYYEQYRTN